MIVWKKLVLVGLLSGSLVSVGCGDDDGGTPDGGTPDGAAADMAMMGTPLMGSYFQVADSVDISRVQGDMTVNGFDLDGRVSDDADAMGCFIEDRSSPSGTPGIDNQFAELAPTLESLGEIDIAMALSDAINAGDFAILMELTGADSTNDASATALLHLGEPATIPPTLEGGSLAPGQTFNITSTDTIMADGSITNSVFNASVSLITIALPLEGADISLNIRNAQIEFRIDDTGPSLEDGVIGGSLNVDELVTAIAMVPDFAMFEMIARDTLNNMADLEPNADGDCENISIGLDFTAVAAVKGA